MGAEKGKLKAGAAGDKEGKPPIAFSTAAGIASAAQVQPPIAFSTASGIAGAARGQAPLGYLFGRDYKRRRRSNTGVPGAEPPAK